MGRHLSSSRRDWLPFKCANMSRRVPRAKAKLACSLAAIKQTTLRETQGNQSSDDFRGVMRALGVFLLQTFSGRESGEGDGSDGKLCSPAGVAIK